MISYEHACRLAAASRVACDSLQSAREREYQDRMAAQGKRIGTWVLATAIADACSAPGTCVCLDSNGVVYAKFITKKAADYGSDPYVLVRIGDDRGGDTASAVQEFLEKTAGFPGSAFTVTRSFHKVTGKRDVPVSTLSIRLDGA